MNMNEWPYKKPMIVFGIYHQYFNRHLIFLTSLILLFNALKICIYNTFPSGVEYIQTDILLSPLKDFLVQIFVFLGA